MRKLLDNLKLHSRILLLLLICLLLYPKDADANFAYVTNGGTGTVSVIDTSTNTVIAATIDAKIWFFGRKPPKVKNGA